MIYFTVGIPKPLFGKVHGRVGRLGYINLNKFLFPLNFEGMFTQFLINSFSAYG
jgi:hypothetical protein